jgi:hypothetical protein
LQIVYSCCNLVLRVVGRWLTNICKVR